MRRNATLFGIVGLVLVAFGLVDYFIATGFRFFVIFNLTAGVFALVIWITSSRSALVSIAGSRSTRYGANAVIYTVAFVGVLVALNYLSSLHHRRLDLTAEKVFSLSSQSLQVVKDLKQPLKFYGFFPGGQSPSAEQLYSTYAYASPQITFELVDPDKHPELAEKYRVSVMNTTHLQYGGEDGEGANVTRLSEEEITNAIIRVTRTGKKIVEFLDGHGEADPDDAQAASGFGSLKKALEGEGYEVRKLLLASQPKVPEDTRVLVIAGPSKPLMPHEVKQISAFLDRGGRLLVTVRPQPPYEGVDESALTKLLGRWGVKVGNDVVVDQVVRLFAGPALGLSPLVQTYGDHPVTRDFKQRTIFPMTRSLAAEADGKPGLTVTDLAKTSPTSWAESDLDGIFKRQEAKLDGSDVRGPLSVADAVEADLKKLGRGEGQARIIVIGSTQAADNQYLHNFFNRDFLVNAVDWLAGEEKSISIRPRALRASRFRLTVDQFSVVFALSVLLLPELLLIAGVVVWWKRRT